MFSEKGRKKHKNRPIEKWFTFFSKRYANIFLLLLFILNWSDLSKKSF